MRIEIDIATRLGGDHGFELESRFATDDARVILFGPSGSGKSLTLAAIAGLIMPDRGSIRIGGRTLFDADAGVSLPARLRRVGFLFQDYALFPHLSVRENVGFGLKRLLRPLSRRHATRVNGMLDLFGLLPLAERRPHEISGGQRQRVALARAIVTRPDVLLLDEPFSALDQPLRVKMREELLRTLDYVDIPLVLVTHDPADVVAFGQTIVTYAAGKVSRVDDLASMRADGLDIEDVMRRAYAGF